MAKTKEKLKSRNVPITKLSLRQVLDMYEIFCKYYDNVDQKTFMEDMCEKEIVFLLQEKSTGKITGFSTLKKVTIDINGKMAVGLFSGDTILEKEYWGSRALHMAMFKYVVLLKLRKPLTSVYWLLISKGYKTYLLLANNFQNYYPRLDANTSQATINSDVDLKLATSQYCQQLFPNAFVPEKMLLDFGDKYQKLLGNVADITPDMREKSEKIDFFEKSNPTWRSGTELPCLGEVSVSALTFFIKKMIARKRSNAKNHQHEKTPLILDNSVLDTSFANSEQA